MNYIELLTKEEKLTLCHIIGGKYFGETFKRNEAAFNKLRKGFRAKTVSDSVALSTAVSNIDKPFIASAVNNAADLFVQRINTNIELLEKNGIAHDIALASTMVDSPFVNNIELFFQLISQPLDDTAHTKLLEQMEKIKSERISESEKADRVKELEEEKKQLLGQAEMARLNSEAARAEYEQRISELEQDKNTLEEMLTEAKEKIDELQTAASGEDNDSAERLAVFDDSNLSLLPSVFSEETVSLCEIVNDYSGQKWLIRRADLSHSGHYHIFHRNEDNPPFFANRDRLYCKDGPAGDGTYGIWTWSAVPNYSDPAKDYVISLYNKDLAAIEVFILHEASSLEELVALLKDGIEYQARSRKVLFAYCESRERYVGVLCGRKDISSTNGKTVFADDFINAPVYHFIASDIIRLDNDIYFFRNAFAGIPIKLYQLKRPIDITKDIVFKSISWEAYKARGFISTDYKIFKDFLANIPVLDVMGQIQATCHCSALDARDLLNEFLNSAHQYVDGTSLEDDIILSAIVANKRLQARTKELLKADWESENKMLLAQADRNLTELDSQLKQAKARLEAVEKSFEQTKAEEARISVGIAEKEKLAKDVENAVAERIERARTNAAEFIAGMAFAGSQPVRIATADVAADEDAAARYSVVDKTPNQDELEKYNNWANVIETAALELLGAGVCQGYDIGLAAFLCAAFIEKQPIMLVGPNALDIVQAFCAAICAQKYGVLNCEGVFSNRVIDEIGSSGEKVVAINNLLTSGWMNRLPEILVQKDIFYFATHPYTEDVQVEPKSVYGFMLPLFTEFFVDRKATGEYYGGYFADNFEDYTAQKKRREVKALSRFPMSALIRSRISSLVATMHGINANATADDDFLFAILPFAYATMAFDELSKALSDSQRGISISANLRRNLQYILGDD